MMLLSLKRDRQHQDRQAVDEQGCAQGHAWPTPPSQGASQWAAANWADQKHVWWQGVPAGRCPTGRTSPAAACLCVSSFSRASLLESSVKAQLPRPRCGSLLLNNASTTRAASSNLHLSLKL